MAQGFLDRDQVHPAQIELRGAEVPQDMRGQICPAIPAGARRRGPASPARRVSLPARAALPSAFRSLGQTAGHRTGVIIIEQDHTSWMNHRKVRPAAVDQRHHPLPRPGPAGALADADVELPEPAQVPLHVSQIQVADLVHPQPDIGHQPGRRIVAGGRGELPARRQLRPPPGEQHAHLHRRRRDPQRGPARTAGPVHLIQRAFGHPAGHLVDLGLMPDLHEPEIVLSACDRASRSRLAASRSTLPKYASASAGSISHNGLPNQPAAAPDEHVRADRVIRQASRRPGQHEPGQHIGLERCQLFRAQPGCAVHAGPAPRPGSNPGPPCLH